MNFRSRGDLKIVWGPFELHRRESRLVDSARERKTKRAQWLRDPHSFEPGVIPRLASF